MKEITLKFTVEGSGAGVCQSTVQAPSDFNARRLVEATYGGPSKVRIFDSTEVRPSNPSGGGPNR